MKLAERVTKLPESGIRKMFALAEKYNDTVNLCIGEPGFDTPQNIIDAGCNALNNGYTKYISNAGFLQLREKIAKKMIEKNGFSNINYENVIVNFGAGQSLMSSFQAILNPGDEILVPNPCFSNYLGYTSLAQGVAVMVPTYEEDGFHVKADIVEKYITDKSKAIIINTPSNPTGAVTPREEIEKIAELAKKHDLIVISDEPYEDLIYDNNKHFSIATIEGMFERTITINSFSKTYAMTGWRIGYAVGPKDLINAMILIQGSLTANVTAAVQVAALEALQGDQSCIKQMVDEYKKRRDYLVENLNKLNGVSCIMPEGAFYAFANIKKTGMSSEKMAIDLLEKTGVVVTPGVAFGPAGEGYIRLSFAASMKDIQKAMIRMKEYFGEKNNSN